MARLRSVLYTTEYFPRRGVLSHLPITMCKVQQSVLISIPIMDGNEDNDVVVMSDRNAESRAKEQKGGDCSFLAGILLGAGIFALFLLPGSPCLCSFHSFQNDHSNPAVFLRGAASEMPDFYLDFHTTPVQHLESPPNAQLRYAPLPPISPEASSMESPSKDSYELQRSGSSLSSPSKDSVRTVSLETDKSSDSTNASEKASSEHDGKFDRIASEDADFTPKTVSSEDTWKSSFENDPDILSPVKGRRSIITPK